MSNNTCPAFAFDCQGVYASGTRPACTCESEQDVCLRPLPRHAEKCGGCGHRRDDHFEGQGVCDLGFCSLGCATFVD